MKENKFKSDIVESFRKLNSFSDFLKDYAQDIHKDDRLAVIIVYGAVELAVDFLVSVMCKHGSKILKDRVPFMGKVIILSELRVIDDKLFNNLKGIKTLRDKAAHPTKDIEWRGKFAFDKKGNIYKAVIKEFGEPQDLIGYLHCVWNTLFMAGGEACAKGHFEKMQSLK